VQAYKQGDRATFDLKQGAVLQILSALPTCTPVKSDAYGTSFCDLSATTDLTGTEISASEEVAVFAGHNCAFVPFDKWACDHLEEQIYPIHALGKAYVGAHTLSSGSDPSVYRILSVADQNTVTFNPAVRAPVTLDRGKFVELESTQDFMASGSKPFLMAQFMNLRAGWPKTRAPCGPLRDTLRGATVPVNTVCSCKALPTENQPVTASPAKSAGLYSLILAASALGSPRATIALRASRFIWLASILPFRWLRRVM